MDILTRTILDYSNIAGGETGSEIVWSCWTVTFCQQKISLSSSSNGWELLRKTYVSIMSKFWKLPFFFKISHRALRLEVRLVKRLIECRLEAVHLNTLYVSNNFINGRHENITITTKAGSYLTMEPVDYHPLIYAGQQEHCVLASDKTVKTACKWLWPCCLRIDCLLYIANVAHVSTTITLT